MRARPKISLKMQAINFLSRREHSRQELRSKLLASLCKSERERLASLTANRVHGERDAAEVAAGEHHPDDMGGDASVAADAEAQVEELLDWLTANKYLSDTRFVESRLHARAAKQGASMIRHELARHGLSLEPEQAAMLRDTEFARARALWQRKFGAAAEDARDRARQARFLIARGFGSDVVRRIVGGLEQGE